MARAIIKAERLEVTYNPGKQNEYKALRGVDVSIYPGEYIILFGPSGCGKSTLLYCVLGLLPPTGGEMIVRGENIYEYSSKESVNYQRYICGIVYQKFNLVPSLNVQDNVSLPQIFASIDKKARDRHAMELLTRFGVEMVAHKIPANLSGGQAQRVAVARSLINNPEILLGDEPVGNLDSISAEAVMDKLDQINSRDKKTVILVTHDAKYLPFAHRVYYLRDGRIEREVVNPEKKQIKKVEPGTTIVTEIEKLARQYPYLSIEELRVKSIVNYLTQSLDFDQLQQLEKTVEEAIEGKISEKNLFDLLVEQSDKGGVGLNKKVSLEMSSRVKKIIKEARDVRRYRRNMKKDLAFYYQHKFTERLKKYLLEEYGSKLTNVQEKRLDEIITDRVSGVIDRDGFLYQIDLAENKGGLGLHANTAKTLSRYLEKLLAQGVEIIKSKH